LHYPLANNLFPSIFFIFIFFFEVFSSHMLDIAEKPDPRNDQRNFLITDCGTSAISLSNFGWSTSAILGGGFFFGGSGFLMGGRAALPLIDATFSSFTTFLAAILGTIKLGGKPFGS
jgi:hypothetical protein